MSEQQQESVLVDGLYFNKKHENAPDFVKGGVGMKVAELVPFLQKHVKADGYVNAQLLVSKAGKLYFKLDNFEAKAETTPVDNEQPPVTKEDSPF